MPPRPLAALAAIAAALARAEVRWLLAGSAGRALLGARVRPGDIDIEIDDGDAGRAEAALAVALTGVSGGGVGSRRGSVRRAGVEVDVTCGFAVDGPARLPPDFALQWRWALPAAIGGRPIRVAPPEEALCRAIARGDWARVAAIADGATGPLRAGYVAERLCAASSSATR